jgi:UDP-N-acetylmuramoyl-L-alanyl-D-glutamate--2,6-diaminopimelate ligase
MELASLLNNVKVIQVVGEISRERITGIYYDSRKVTKNSIFVAIKGFKTDGHKFIFDAINKGAAAIVLEDDAAFPDDAITRQNAAKVLVKDSREALAELADSFFDEPSKKIKLIGVTGTNGKTTTTYFIKSIFETAGYKTGLVGTISNFIGDKEIVSSLTTPESNDLNLLFQEMYSQGCKYAVMEVSSHSLVLKRVHKLFFSAGIFTNLTQDHLDFHSNFENYFNAKKILFDNIGSSASAIYNIDDPNGSKIVVDSKAKIFSYGRSEGSDFKLMNTQFDLNGTSFTVKYKDKEYKASTTLIGDFNAYNACAAFSTAMLLGISSEAILQGIKNTKSVPGRFEVIGKENKKVIVDYSHTPDSLEKALLAIRKIVKNDKPIYVVFGCGGNRDRIKRPMMGKIASEMADKVIVTSDNPRFEEPITIIEEIKSGISKKNYTVIENREEAIKNAIQFSEDDAVILIAGKGHETYQEIKGVRNHFSDKEIAEKYLIK